MATAPKRKYISKNNQEQLLRAFYDNLGNDEDSLLRLRFADEDDNDVESGTDSEEGSEGEDTLESIVNDAADADSEPLIEAFNGDDIAENEDRDNNEAADEVENQLSIEQPNRQKFKNLDEVLEKDKYRDLLTQRIHFFK